MRWFFEKMSFAARNGRGLLKQIEATLNWMRASVAEDDVILLDFPKFRKFFYFKFPLQPDDEPKLIGGSEQNPTFVIRKPKTAHAESDWKRIFFSPELEALERKNRIKTGRPLRWGLEEQEKTIALKIARDALEQFFLIDGKYKSKILSGSPKCFNLKTDLDAALWVDGRLRGSYVIENRHLWDGIQEAAVGAATDARFKPLVAGELKNTRIEITLFSPIRVPLAKSKKNHKHIFPEKGYLLIKGKKKGLYLPQILNIRRFRTLEGFLGDLAQEKAGLNRASYKNAEVLIFEVEDFIESKDQTKALALWGPIVPVKEDIAISPELFLSRLRLAADWLCFVQEADGNIPPVINPITGQQKQIDWVRLAFVGRALAEFGLMSKEKKYIAAAEGAFRYLRWNLVFCRMAPSYRLTLSYYGELALLLGKSDEADAAALKICDRLFLAEFEPMTFAQISGFLKAISKSRRQFMESYEDTTRIIKDSFERKLNHGNEMPLAAWAEAVGVFLDIDPEFYAKTRQWLIDKQLPGGAFPESTTSDFVYTRGTSKILEVLTLDPKNNQPAIAKTIRWLLSMQYDEENTYFVPKDNRPKIMGGFRHDYFNQEVWIDSAGHFLLAGARLLAHEPET